MFGKKRLFRQMEEYVNIVQAALYAAAITLNRAKTGAEDKRVAAAIANLLVGRGAAPDHTAQEIETARERSGELVRFDPELRFAAVMCLRTTGIVKGPPTSLEVMKTIDWVRTLGELPGHPPDPDIMQKLAYDVGLKYGVIKVG